MKNLLLCLATCLAINVNAQAQTDSELSPRKAILSPATKDGWHEVKVERPSCECPNYTSLIDPLTGDTIRILYPLKTAAYIKRVGEELIFHITDQTAPSDTLSMITVPDSLSGHCINCTMAFVSGSGEGEPGITTNIRGLYVYVFPNGQYGWTVETLVR